MRLRDDDAFKRERGGMGFSHEMHAVEQQPSSIGIRLPREIAIAAHDRILTARNPLHGAQ